MCKRLSDATLCPSCAGTIREAGYGFLFKHRCPVCGNPVLDTSYACPFCSEGKLSYGPYGKTLASLIRRYKFGGERSLTPLLAGLYLPLLASIDSPLLLPIPCSREGYKRRGFDQMIVITSYLARKEGYLYLPLFAKRKGKQYKLLSKEQRFHGQTLQLTNSKRARKQFQQLIAAGYTAVLIDDVSTTGSTFHQAKELLKLHFNCETAIVVLTNA